MTTTQLSKEKDVAPHKIGNERRRSLPGVGLGDHDSTLTQEANINNNIAKDLQGVWKNSPSQ